MELPRRWPGFESAQIHDFFPSVHIQFTFEHKCWLVSLGLVASPSPDYRAWVASPGPLEKVCLSQQRSARSAIICILSHSSNSVPRVLFRYPFFLSIAKVSNVKTSVGKCSILLDMVLNKFPNALYKFTHTDEHSRNMTIYKKLNLNSRP